MRIGVLAEIHGTIDALDAVLEFLDGQRMDFILCAGDVVGYGACPVECIERLRKRGIPTVRGNHDQYAFDTESTMVIRASARERDAGLPRDLADRLALGV